MARVQDLIALGMPAELAKRVGVDVITVTTAGTTQGSSGGALGGPGNKVVVATPHAGDGAVTLPADSEIGDKITVYNAHASNDLNVFPPSGGTILNLSANAGTPLEDNQSMEFIKVTSTNWIGRLVAEPVAT